MEIEENSNNENCNSFQKEETLSLETNVEDDEELESHKEKRNNKRKFLFDEHKILKTLIKRRSHLVLYGYYHSVNNEVIHDLFQETEVSYITINVLLANHKTSFLSELSLRINESFKEDLKEVKTLEDFVEMIRIKKDSEIFSKNIYVVLKNCERMTYSPKFLSSFIRVCNYGKLPFSVIFEAISIAECYGSSYEFTMIPKFHMKSFSESQLTEKLGKYFEPRLPNYATYFASNLVQTFSYLTKEFDLFKKMGNLLIDSLLKFHIAHLLEQSPKNSKKSKSKKAKKTEEEQELCKLDFTQKNLNYLTGKKILLRDPYVHFSSKEFNQMIEKEKNITRENTVVRNYFKNDYSTVPKLGRIILLAAFLGNRNKVITDNKILIDTEKSKKGMITISNYKIAKPVKIHRLIAICQALMQHSQKYPDESTLFNHSVDFYATLANLIERKLLMKINSKSYELTKLNFLCTIEKEFAKDIASENDLKFEEFYIE